MAEMKYAVCLMGHDTPTDMKKMTLTEARIKACRIAKNYPNSYQRVGIFVEDKYHISGGRYMPKLIEYVQYSDRERMITGDVLDGFYLWQRDKNRLYRVSPKTGRLLDISKDWRYV